VVTTTSNTVVLIHGLWMTPLAWEHWVTRYEARGFTVLTPGYPGIGQGEAGLQALRENPDAVAGVGVREIMDYLTDYIVKLDTAPIIMGHSFGGTFSQLLVGNGLGSAGVSIDGAAVKGINAMPLSEVRSVLPALDNPANINKASTLTPKQFHYAFTNAQDDAVSQHAYDRYSAPTPAKVLFQGGFAAVTPHAATTFNFADDDRAPLLFISGGSDHILPTVVQDRCSRCARPRAHQGASLQGPSAIRCHALEQEPISGRSAHRAWRIERASARAESAFSACPSATLAHGA
jgi:pimeloyl-ACP methyl ester carboxylesterase